MPKMVHKKTGKEKKLKYDPSGIKEAHRLQAEDPDWQMVKTQRYQTGGLVHRSSSRKREKTRGTGAATRCLDFYKS